MTHARSEGLSLLRGPELRLQHVRLLLTRAAPPAPRSAGSADSGRVVAALPLTGA